MTTRPLPAPQPSAGRRLPPIRLLLAVLVSCSLLAAACSSSDDGGDAETGGTDAGGSAAPATEPVDETDETVDPVEPGEAPLELGRGVTDDTITLGFIHLDLDDIREQGIIDLNWGPQAEHARTLADHINANGGINGRNIEIIVRPLDPVNPDSAQSACLEFTEDREVFAVLGTLRGDEVLCYTEQHQTVAISNADMTQERLDRSAAPYVAINAGRERTAELFIGESVEQGLFDDRTLAVISVDATGRAADIAIPALNDAGVDVDLEVLIQGDGSVGGAAAELTANVESMRARGIDAVLVVGDAIVPVNTFIGEGFFPTMFFADQGSANAVAGRADLSLFPAAYTYGGPTAAAQFDEAQFQEECIGPWDALNPDAAAQNPAEVPAGEPSHAVGLRVACRVLSVFTTIAEAAGPNLNNDTFAAALEEIGEFDLPAASAASLGEGKYDALDELLLTVHNPDAADDEPEFIEFGG